MVWNIVADSSCDLQKLECPNGEHEIHFYTVPFVITVGKKDYRDDGSIVIDDLLHDMEISKEASYTSCPSPGAWLEHFSKEGNTIALTISGELSGSYNSANSAKDLLLGQEPDRNIAIINSVSTGPGMIMLMQNIVQNIQKNKSFQEVMDEAQQLNERKKTIFALSSFNNLVKNGRMSPIVGFVAQKLNFWGIGMATEIGQIAIIGKVRGGKKALQAISRNIRENLSVRKVIISHCKNQQLAEELQNEIRAAFLDVAVEIYETQGLCSYYAERNGLIIAYV